MKNFGGFEDIKTNKNWRKFDYNGVSIFKNRVIYDAEYLVLTNLFEFEVRLGKHEVWNDVLYYSGISADGNLYCPDLSNE